MIRVELPYHLRNLAQVQGEVEVTVAAPVTIGRILDALETAYPVLRGTIRDTTTGQRRAFLRFFACQEDWSNASLATPLPTRIVRGEEPLMVLGAIAGG